MSGRKVRERAAAADITLFAACYDFYLFTCFSPMRVGMDLGSSGVWKVVVKVDKDIQFGSGRAKN